LSALPSDISKIAKRSRIIEGTEISLYFARSLLKIPIDALEFFHGWPVFGPFQRIRQLPEDSYRFVGVDIDMSTIEIT